MTRVAVLCDRLGPYHFARLTAASEHIELHAIELQKNDHEYAWDLIQSESVFHRVTLFESVLSVPGKVIRRKLYEALDAVRPDVVFVGGWSGAFALAAVSYGVERKVPLVVMSESNQFDAKRTAVGEFAKRQLMKLMSAGFVGGRSHQKYLEVLGLEAARCHLGYDAVDNAYYTRQASNARSAAELWRLRLNLPDHYFLACSRFVEKKNLIGLLMAYSEYHRQCGAQGWDLVLLGDGPLRGQILQFCNTNALSQRVHLPGFKQYDVLPAYFALAKVFVHPSVVEQWGLVINEAMACGLPIIASNRCGASFELVEHGVNGWTFDPLNTDELAEHMLRVSIDPISLTAYGEASVRRIDAWGLERFATGFLSAAEVAIDKGPMASRSFLSRAVLRTLMSTAN